MDRHPSDPKPKTKNPVPLWLYLIVGVLAVATLQWCAVRSPREKESWASQGERPQTISIEEHTRAMEGQIDPRTGKPYDAEATQRRLEEMRRRMIEAGVDPVYWGG